MKYLGICGMAVCFILMTGCQNTELIQCQQDNQQLQKQLKTCTTYKKGFEDVANKVTEELAKLKEQHKAEIEQIRSQTRADMVKSMKQQRTQMAQKASLLRESQKGLKKLEARCEELEGQLAESKELIGHTSDMLKDLAEENKTLKAKLTNPKVE